MTKKVVANIPEYKTKTVEELNKLIKENKTILLASIKNIPGSQFQEIKKKLRGKAVVKVPKKNLILRAIDENASEEIEKLKQKIDDSVAILFSNMDAFELAGELLKSQSPAKAKAGQEAPTDIEIPDGPTDLVPGPAVSELGGLGIQIQIQEGKIHIKEPKIVAKQGEAIKPAVADLMAKLDIKPFKIGFIPLCAFDVQENKFYSSIKIDKEGTLADLKYAFGKALPFAVSIGYVSKDTVGFMIQKAGAQANKINRIMTGEPEPVVEAVSEAPAEEPKEETKSEEDKQADAGAGLASLF